MDRFQPDIFVPTILTLAVETPYAELKLEYPSMDSGCDTVVPIAEPLELDLPQIRRDGGTQGRVSINQTVVAEYAYLMKTGCQFPPVRVWFDGTNYWLSDGFHRVAAAEIVGASTICAELFVGPLDAARWDSFASNASHGLRRTKADVTYLIAQALTHPNSRQLSNRQLARHLNIPETTLRRWRGAGPARDGAEATRIVRRGESRYTMNTAHIGKKGNEPLGVRFEKLRRDIDGIRSIASPRARPIITVLRNWVIDGVPAVVCLDRIEEILLEGRN